MRSIISNEMDESKEMNGLDQCETDLSTETPYPDFTAKSQINRWNAIVLSGGGLRGLAHLGVLHGLVTQGVKLSDIEVLAGTSVGFIICTMISMGVEPMELFDHIYTLEQFFSLGDINHISAMFSSLSLISIETVKFRLKELIKIKWKDEPPTLKQLYDSSHQTLIGVTINANTGEIVYMSHVSHPNLSCLDAMAMSCALPWAFSPLYIDGVEYVDGGLLDNFPVAYVETIFPRHKCLGVLLRPADNSTPLLGVEKRIRLMSLPMDELTKLRSFSCKADILRIKVPCLMIEFMPSSERKMRIFLLGVDCVAETFFGDPLIDST